MVYSLNKTLSCNIVVGGIVLPYNPSFGKLSGGVCDRTGKFIENTALHEKYYDGSYPYNKSNVKLKQKKAIYLGTWCGIYGHAITDNLKKIWFLESEEFKNLLKKDNPDLVYNYLGGGR